MKRVLTLICILITAFAFSGCGDKGKFTGNWSADIDMTQYITDVLKSEAETADFVKINSFMLYADYEFKKDGTYLITSNISACEDAFEKLKEDYSNCLLKAYEASYNEIGLTITQEELLQEVSKKVDEVFTESFVENIIYGIETEGKYKVKGGKLYCSDSVDIETEENNYQTYEIVNDSEIKLLKTDVGQNFKEITYQIILSKK